MKKFRILFAQSSKCAGWRAFNSPCVAICSRASEWTFSVSTERACGWDACAEKTLDTQTHAYTHDEKIRTMNCASATVVEDPTKFSTSTSHRFALLLHIFAVITVFVCVYVCVHVHTCPIRHRITIALIPSPPWPAIDVALPDSSSSLHQYLCVCTMRGGPCILCIFV